MLCSITCVCLHYSYSDSYIVFIDPFDILSIMDLCNQPCYAVIMLSILHGENVNIEHYAQTFQPHSLYLKCLEVPLTSTIGVGGKTKKTYFFSVTYSESKSVDFIYLHTSKVILMKFDVMLKQFKLNSLIQVRVRFLQ